MHAKEIFTAIIENQLPLILQQASLMQWLQLALLVTQRQMGTLIVEIERFSYEDDMKKALSLFRQVLPGICRSSSAKQNILRLCDQNNLEVQTLQLYLYVTMRIEELELIDEAIFAQNDIGGNRAGLIAAVAVFALRPEYN